MLNLFHTVSREASKKQGQKSKASYDTSDLTSLSLGKRNNHFLLNDKNIAAIGFTQQCSEYSAKENFHDWEPT